MKTYRLKAAVVLAVVAAGLWAMRAEAAGAVRGEIKAVIVTKAPAIDGTMADAQWQQGAELVFGPTKEGKIDPNSGTTGRVLFDDQNIYIGVTCKAKDIKAQVAQRDGQVWDDDCIELFVSPDLSEGYYHIIVNALGTIYDEYCGAFVKKVEKNLGIVVKATMKQGESWTVTLAIPLDAVNTYFGENLPWRLNVTRTQGAHGGEKARELSWADLGTDNFHTPDRFGRITDLNMKQRRDNAFLPQPPGKTGQQLGKRGTAEAVMVPKGPEIDGSMKDPIWAKGTLVVLGDPNSEDGDPLQRTAARVLFDAKNFYIGIFCRDELTGSLVAQKTARDSDVWSDDCVEIYAAPDADEEWYQFIVNSKGALFDQKVAKGRKDKSYNANAQLKASVENERGWCVTMAIPLTDLNAYVGEKLSWRFNITRYRQKRTQGEKADEYSWSKIGPNGFADPLSFGAITGISIPKTADGVTREMDPELINYKPRAKQGEVELLATADIWLSDCGEEKLNSMGAAPHFKIKSVQEVACIRFDVTPLRGKEIKKATLYMRREGTDQLRRFPIFTVGQTWTEGTTKDDYGKGSGSCFAWADFDTKKPWAWPVSDFWDVSCGNGNSIGIWKESTKLRNGWIAVEPPLEVIYAMIAGSTDGMCVMDGGTLEYFNNFLHSVQSKGNEPRLIVELGKALADKPAKPAVKAAPAPDKAHMETGAIRLTVGKDESTFCYNVKINGSPVERWRIAYPNPSGDTQLVFDEVPPDASLEVELVAVSRGGEASPPATATVKSSLALPRKVQLGKINKPEGGSEPKAVDGKMKVWPLPGLVQISPEKSEVVSGDMVGNYRAVNAAWDGRAIKLCGAKGEYASYQLCIERAGADPLKGVKVQPKDLKGPKGGVIGGTEIELIKNWYVLEGGKTWRPGYAIPLAHGEAFDIPDPKRQGSVDRPLNKKKPKEKTKVAFPNQQNQTIYVDVYIPKDAKPGQYKGSVSVQAEGVSAAEFPVELTVWDFALPDKLSFWPELNAYGLPGTKEGALYDFYRMAHQHRCVMNAMGHRPKVTGAGKDIKVDWTDYDAAAGPLLSGEVFKNNRRSGQPLEVMYLPFSDNWPTGITRKNYSWDGLWPSRGGTMADYTPHFLMGPYIGDGLSQDYKDAFQAVERQFIEHFKEKGWNTTEMQNFFGNKVYYRTEYGLNDWWTTDEPYILDDWLGLQFFNKLFTEGRKAANGDPKIWGTRGDISRPWNQGHLMDGVLTCAYYGSGGFNGETRMRRCRILSEQAGFNLRAYGGGGFQGHSTVICLWLNGANAMLPWQTIGNDSCLDIGDEGLGGGAGMLIPGKRFGLQCMGDLRLKSMRDGEQIIEYLVLLQKKYNLTREQIRDLIEQRIKIEYTATKATRMDDADATATTVVPVWDLAELRKLVAEAILK